ncbi:MAG: response regulator [Limisphaerales bacterium]
MNPRNIIVWLIEDNASYCRNAAAAIDDAEGLSCPLTFRRCEDALENMASEVSPDVILLDIGLPGMSGLEGIGYLLEKSPDTKVVILTVFEDENKIFNAICAGAHGYLLKTARLNEIVGAIHDVVSEGATIDSRIAQRILGFFKTAKVKDYRLTPRETEILQKLVEGLIKKEIADQLDVSFHTVDMHLRNIYRKLQVNTATAAVAKAVRERIV